MVQDRSRNKTKHTSHITQLEQSGTNYANTRLTAIGLRFLGKHVTLTLSFFQLGQEQESLVSGAANLSFRLIPLGSKPLDRNPSFPRDMEAGAVAGSRGCPWQPDGWGSWRQAPPCFAQWRCSLRSNAFLLVHSASSNHPCLQWAFEAWQSTVVIQQASQQIHYFFALVPEKWGKNESKCLYQYICQFADNAENTMTSEKPACFNQL